MKTDNHYERAFAHYLQYLEIPYLATRENQRCFAGNQEYGSLKNIDFLVFNRRNSRFILEPEVVAAPRPNGSSLPGALNGFSEEPHAKDVRISWLIDIKGRRFPSGQKSPQYWRNWVNEDDLLSINRWEALLGTDFHGLLVFAYHVLADRSPIERSRLFLNEGNYYAFMAIPATVYSRCCRTLSPRWRTLTMPSVEFRKKVQPIQNWLE